MWVKIHAERAMEKQTEKWTGRKRLSETRNVLERVTKSVSVIEIEGEGGWGQREREIEEEQEREGGPERDI